MNKLKMFTGLLLLASLTAGLLLATACSGEEEPVEATPDAPPVVEAPDFTLQRPDGTTVTLSDLRGKAVLLNFWATWCGPCRAEMPHIQAVYDDPAWQARGLEILAVNVGESAAKVSGFMKDTGFSFPVLVDSSQKVPQTYNVRAIPTTYFIDENGIMVAVKMGAFVSMEDLEQALKDTIFTED